jgi:integral membrane protein (TIGR01906 family)
VPGFRLVSAIIAGIALAVLVVGMSLYPMLHPTFTQILANRYSEVSEIGLPHLAALRLAEQVREFVADGDVDQLPASVNGRPGFDAAAVSHLRDVRRVLAGARTFTGVLAAVMAVWLGVMIASRRFSQIASAMLAAAIACVAFVLLGIAAGLLDFDSLFAWFHSLFFASGTWTFPADSLLIELFPEGFWVAAGATWAGLVLLGGALLGVGGWFLRGAETNAKGRSANRSSTNGA